MTTAASGSSVAVCPCCIACGLDIPASDRVVICPECGYPCSCEGCIADAGEPA